MSIYECCKQLKDVNKTDYPVYYAKTEKEAIKWLENKGGGIYKNTLHNFKLYIPPKTTNI